MSKKKPMRRWISRVTVLCLLLTTALPDVSAQTSFLNSAAYVNVRSYGAKGDAVTNDTAAVRAAVAAAAKGGKTVFFPAGLYNLNESIAIPAGVNIEGVTSATNGPWQNLYDGESKNQKYNGKSSSNYFDPAIYAGSWILASNGSGNVDAGATFQLQGDNEVRRIGFVSLMSPPVNELETTPSPPVIGADINQLASTKGIVIEDISLANPYYGIAVYQGSLKNYNTSAKLSGKSSGPVTIRNVMGAAMYRGISIMGANGKVSLDNLQFNYANYGTTYVKEHWNNCVDIDLAACTDVTVTNVLSFGAYTGLQTSSAFSGSPVNVTARNLNLEGEKPLVLKASGTQNISNSYLLLTNFADASVKKDWTAVTIQQDAASSAKAAYTLTGLVFQDGLSTGKHMDITLQGGATVNLTNGVIWNWDSGAPLIRYTHSAGGSSKVTITNLSLCSTKQGQLAAVGGSAYQTGELTFQYCRLNSSVLGGLTGAGSRVKFIQCSSGGQRISN